ncbi:TetR/AcrR family transcriptional regulator [Nocardioides lijunqiniae]|uniref:TetR/AcrR family transcriptional regulator n=1 Tax=Nocardioides lijunqiniae TaxID=2760832 RepID=UPI001877B8F1|nr:TetR/AcrR family transcriptional regulator [Nocardioides lijunqiniae]
MTAARAAREPQQGRSRETVERILEAAEQEISGRGVAAAGTRAIAARAGLSVGALYRFFPDKDAIVDALTRRYLADLTPAYAATVAQVAPGADLAQVVRTLVSQAAELQLAHPGYYRLTEELPPEDGDSPAHQVRESVVDLFVGALRSAGVGTPGGDPTEVRRVVALCVETVRHTLGRAPVDAEGREAAVEELSGMVAAYVQARFSGG